MIRFFGNRNQVVFAVELNHLPSKTDEQKLSWLFGNQPVLEVAEIQESFIGPRAAMVTPWSTNAVEITQNMGIRGIVRIERFQNTKTRNGQSYDPMLFQKYSSLNQSVFTIDIKPAPIQYIEDIASYNKQEGLALSDEEVAYLEDLSLKLGRKLTDSEVFGFSQVNSEHCRHKIFNGTFVIDGEEKPDSLFQLIKKTSKVHPNHIVSAYKDNVAFFRGPKVIQFSPAHTHTPSFYTKKEINSVLSLKAETHNFPTTVEPFNGAATGSGGEIRDRLAGGIGSLPLAGTAVYMTAYPRLGGNRPWEKGMPPRKWLYQTPLDILIKASNGASDFGNKFGQPLIAGSLFTFEHLENQRKLAYDKVIMLAGGVGYGNIKQALKKEPEKGDHIVIMGGDNYRIGMGGAAVSSTDTGEYSSGIELNAVQRSNPEMQKRVANVIRAMVESDQNPIVSIHDHGAGGHLNCLSELVEETGGEIYLDELPVGDLTLSAKEIIGNESQERMGLVIHPDHWEQLRKTAERERAPVYKVGVVTGDGRFSFEDRTTNNRPMDMELADMFGSSPKTIMNDRTVSRIYASVGQNLAGKTLEDLLEKVLRLESVACKDWLTNKVDRCVGGLVAKQQCAGSLQLPLNNCGVVALDFKGKSGVATSIGHAPASGLIDAVAGAKNAIAEALTNLVWAPLENGLSAVSLSANWMWPCRNEGEDARLYEAVQAVSDFAIALGINIPTGKDSLSMKQKYDDEEVIAPGTVVISAAAHCIDKTKVVEPVLQKEGGPIYYLNLTADRFYLGGSALAQTLNKVGMQSPTIKDASLLKRAFNIIQQLILDDKIVAGHDVSAGGLITTLLEMCFAEVNQGADIDLTGFEEQNLLKILFSENSGVVLQASDASVEKYLLAARVPFYKIGKPAPLPRLRLAVNSSEKHELDIDHFRDVWYETSFLLDQHQTAGNLARKRFDNYKKQPLQYQFPDFHIGKIPKSSVKKRPIAAVIREKGSNSEREMANAMHLAGFLVKDVHMTDLISGRETLEEVQFLGAVGGFSNSDVLGSAKGWAGAFKYNEQANQTLQHFFAREEVLSVGICNGCQLFMELDLINPHLSQPGKMDYNDSQKHESSFTSVIIQPNHSVMMSNLAGSQLGVWISHGEGKFVLPEAEKEYHIIAKYGYSDYPSNPNGSDYNAAMLCSPDGRHLVTMPHIERSIYQWNWANYPAAHSKDEVSPWLQAFVNARDWCVKQ